MKRISSGTVTVCVMAIVVGLVAAFIVKQVLAPKPVEVVEKPREPTVSIVVATKNLKENSVVRRGDVRTILVPVSRQPKNPALRMAQIAEGRIIKQDVKAGAAIRDEMLYGIGDSLPGLESRIPVGMRAMPIHVDEQSVVAKMVNIGSRVDVALTVTGSHPELGEMATKTLLHNVEVIGVDKPSSSTRRGSAANTSATITVAVTPLDANTLITAEGTGTLNMSLCSLANGDEVPVSVGGEDNKVTRASLLGLSPLPPKPAPQKPFTIERWEGGSVKILKISPEHVEEGRQGTLTSKKFNPDQSVPVKAQDGVRAGAAGTSTVTIEDVSPVSTDNLQ